MIAAVGIAVVDHIMRIDGFRSDEGSYHVNSYHMEGGGMAATALCAASKLGSRTRLMTRVGDDMNGRFIIDELGAAGVETDFITVLPGMASTVSWILVDEATGEKQFYSERSKAVFTDHVDMPEKALEGAQVLLLDGHWIEASIEAGKWANRQGVPVVADFKRLYEGLELLFPYIDYFVIPAFFGRELTGATETVDILSKLTDIQAGLPVLTDGANGGVYLEDGQVRSYTAFPVNVIDSTGAGDAFHGAFCHYLAQNRPLADCLTLASAVGAINCLSIGGRSGLPTVENIADFLDANGIGLSPCAESAV